MSRGFTDALMKWHRRVNNRAMPWKGEKDPYKVWLSEIILQQTRVEQGRGYYERFVRAFPDLSSLAAASDGEVFKLWEGLGYYSRCRNLLETARRIARDHGGLFPSTHPGILALKGVGPYTAAAIASFAFGLPHAVVDGNVVRVLSRYFGIEGPVDTASSRRAFSELAQRLLDKGDPGAYNQALMDFGATVCKPASPLCEACCLKSGCIALSKGLVDSLPLKKQKPVRRKRWLYYAHVVCAGCVLIREREGKDIWRGLNELYLLESDRRLSPIELARHPSMAAWTGGGTPDRKSLDPEFVHMLTHQEVRGRFLRVEIAAPRPPVPGYRWVPLEGVGDLAFPKPIADFLNKNG